MNKIKRPFPEVWTADRWRPNCKDKQCDVKENPSHWVDIELAEPYKSGPELYTTLKNEHASLPKHDQMTCETCEILAKARGASPRTIKYIKRERFRNLGIKS